MIFHILKCESYPSQAQSEKVAFSNLKILSTNQEAFSLTWSAGISGFWKLDGGVSKSVIRASQCYQSFLSFLLLREFSVRMAGKISPICN